MCFLASSAYFFPGPGSSDAIRLIATCASVKMVIRSRIVFLLDADSSTVHGLHTLCHRPPGCTPCES